MGKLDALAKAIFAEETERLTDGACQWRATREIPLGEHLLPDGFITALEPDKLARLPAPWSLLDANEALIELKMAGDHMGPTQWHRALLRRAARDVERSLAAEGAWVGYEPLWVVAPSFPDWLGARHVLIPREPGCALVTGFPCSVLWIAANELPLHPSLVPFLTARRGAPRRAFLQWVTRRRERGWVTRLLRVFRMTNAEMQKYLDFFKPEDAEDEAWNEMFVRNWLDKVTPHVRQRLIDEGAANVRRQELTSLFEHRLKRPLTPEEGPVLLARIETLSPERLRTIVLDLSAEALAAWLADPEAA